MESLPYYLKLFARMKNPPLPHLYGNGAIRKDRSAALKQVPVFERLSTNDSALWNGRLPL
eukprot:3373922-Prymnesium_polylepis.2